MALAEIASLIPPISISIPGLLDLDIDLNRHTSVGLPFTSTTKTSTRNTTTPSPVTRTTVTTTPVGSSVTTATNPSTSSNGRASSTGSPTIPAPTTHHISPPTESGSPSPTVIAPSVSGVLAVSSEGTSSAGVGDGSAAGGGLTGIPVAAAEGLPTVGVTVVNGSTIRPVAGITGAGQASVTGGPSTTGGGSNSPTNTPGNHGRVALSSGAVAAIIVCLLLILSCFVFILLRRRRRPRRDQDAILWRIRSYGANAFSRNLPSSSLPIPSHSRKRSVHEATSMLAPTSPRSPTFVIRPMSQARRSSPSLLSQTTQSHYYDARSSISSAISASESHHSSEETWQTAEHTLASEPSSSTLKRQISVGLDSSPRRLSSHIFQPPSPINIPNSAFRLTTVPIPPLPPLPSSPPPIPPSPRIPKYTVNPFDPPASPSRSAFEVKYTDPFQDSTNISKFM
ncbi:hypothetical protein CVT26_009230 [Gymnopilus dilepis]|uniref:Uncharacterized protein n=1 Tax=Gymnopilus dilepis TaxID=231916 RepID=A0A409YRM7_9AGAR|nr:hypothetical protein CVT26_009230 [Gymnopilus dilepis]